MAGSSPKVLARTGRQGSSPSSGDLALTAPSSPTGNICVISIFGVHHNPSVWPEPEVLPLPAFPSWDPVMGRDPASGTQTLPVHCIHLSFLGGSGCPEQPHPAGLPLFTSRYTIPSALTQKRLSRGHLWHLFPSQGGPGEASGCLRRVACGWCSSRAVASALGVPGAVSPLPHPRRQVEIRVPDSAGAPPPSPPTGTASGRRSPWRR